MSVHIVGDETSGRVPTSACGLRLDRLPEGDMVKRGIVTDCRRCLDALAAMIPSQRRTLAMGARWPYDSRTGPVIKDMP